VFAIITTQEADWRQLMQSYRILSVEESAGIQIVHVYNDEITFLFVILPEGKVQTAFGMGRLIERHHIDGCILTGSCTSVDKAHMSIGRLGIMNHIWMRGKCYCTNREYRNRIRNAAGICNYEAIEQDCESYDNHIQDSYLAQKIRMLHMTSLIDRDSGVLGIVAALAGIPYASVKGVTAYSGENECITTEEKNEIINRTIDTAIRSITHNYMDSPVKY